jgi:hypothetical protein
MNPVHIHKVWASYDSEKCEFQYLLLLSYKTVTPVHRYKCAFQYLLLLSYRTMTLVHRCKCATRKSLIFDNDAWLKKSEATTEVFQNIRTKL